MQLASLKRVPIIGGVWQASLDVLRNILFSKSSARALVALEDSGLLEAQRIARAIRKAVVDLEIERERAILLSDRRLLSDGSQPETSSFDHGKTVRDACWDSKPAHLARLLKALCAEFYPNCAIELGTNLGISSAYIAKGLPEYGKLITFEGSANRLRIAKNMHHKLGLNNIHYVEGLFNNTLEPKLKTLPLIDFSFIDGHHQYQPTLDYFNLIISCSRPGTLFVFDDIRWSSGMHRAWSEISADKRVSTVIDFYYLGVCVLAEPGNEKRFFSKPIRAF